MQGRSHWRNTGLSARFFIFDARAVFPLLALVFVRSWLVFWLAIAAMVIFWVIERLGMDFSMAVRYMRSSLAGDRRSVVDASDRRYIGGNYKRRTLTPFLSVAAVMLMVGVMAPTGTAMAAFEIVPTNTDKGSVSASCEEVCRGVGIVMDESASIPTIIHQGKRNIDEAVVEGFGTLPLSEFIEIIKPKGWTHRIESVIDSGQMVTWEGGKPWVYILESVLKSIDLHARVDWDRKQLFIITPKMAYNVHPKLNKTPEDIKPSYIYALKEGEELSDAIKRWADHAGWDVSWSSKVDYPITHDVSLGTDFEAAVTRIVSAYRGARTPLSAKFWGANKVLEIKSMQSRFKSQTMNGE